MNKDLLWVLGLGVAGFVVYEYFSSQSLASQTIASTPVPVTTPQVSNGGTSLNPVTGKYQVAPQLTQADINAITNYITRVYGFNVDPNGVQIAAPGSWNQAYNATLGTSYNWDGAFDPSTYNQLMSFGQWYQVVQATGSTTGLTGLGSIGRLRGWNNANVSRYEVIAAGLPR